MILKEIIRKIEKKYPLQLAYDWDNVGLLVGDTESEIKKILVVLEANEKVVDEAVKNDIDLVVTHHPFIFGKISNVNTTNLKGKLIHKLIKNNIAVYSMHTNFDIAFDGLNDYFMEVMEFPKGKVLDITQSETVYKLAVYVPNTHVDKVKDTLTNSGAGHIGNYSNCTFSSEGIGGFKPLENTNPYVGTQNEIELVKETKIETVVNQKKLGGVISSMLKAHPYEEVAYDVYKLEGKHNPVGLGRVSKLDKEMTLFELSEHIKSKLSMSHIRVVGELDTKIKKVALVTGSGSTLFSKAKREGADVLITGDMKYHEAHDALDMNMTVIDCGHFETENIFKDVMKNFLDEIEGIEIIKSEINLNPFKII